MSSNNARAACSADRSSDTARSIGAMSPRRQLQLRQVSLARLVVVQRAE
jgi:hypothetical protein